MSDGRATPGATSGASGQPYAVTEQRLAVALRTGDLATIERATETLLAPGVVWLGARGGACHCRDEVLTVLRTQLDENLTVRLIELHRVAGELFLHLVLRQDGAAEHDWCTVLSLDPAGRIAHMQDYEDPVVARADIALRARGPERSAAARGPVERLVPFVHVADLNVSIRFYALLGFTVEQTYGPDERPEWASLSSGDAQVMLARATAAVVAEEQAVLFYLRSPDLAGLRGHLVAAGARVGEILDGSPGPKAEMRVTDPDGYCMMVAQTDS